MPKSSGRRVRYAVVGLGYISQVAMLPAFKHARKNSELVALVSGEGRKLRKLSDKYGVDIVCGYDEFDQLVGSGEIDAVYIASPNDQHLKYAEKAAAAGVHVLCEKPMEVSDERCRRMLRAAYDGNVKMMIAYRLHFEEANLTAMKELKRGKIGQPRLFNSVFTMGVRKDNYRAGPHDKGGGPLYDLGIYCVNAARYLFRCEPVLVSAMTFGRNQEKPGASEQSLIASMRFERGQAATFQCSFGAYGSSRYEVLGTKGGLVLENAYEMLGKKTLKVSRKGKTASRHFPAHDQFGPELLYFSDCILKDREPEPNGIEGLVDVRIISALFESARTGRAIALEPIRRPYPAFSQELDLPPVRKPVLVDIEEPSKDEAA